MREPPKENTTTSMEKSIEGSGLIAHPEGKKVFYKTMDNPQTIPTSDMVRIWNMSQRLPRKWVKYLTNTNDPRRYSLALYESIKGDTQRPKSKRFCRSCCRLDLRSPTFNACIY